MTSAWTRQADPAVAPGAERWRAARLEAHWAAQLAAASGATLAEPQEDFGHLALTWLPGPRALAGPTVGEPASPRRTALGVADATLLVLGADDAELARLTLAGSTLESARAWLERGLDLGPLKLPDQRPPEHPLATGAAFGAPDHEALALLETTYANAARALAEHRAGLEGAQPVRMWPHHFDIAVLQPLGEGGEEAPSLGFGWSPGDSSYPDGYWYVLPWPPRPEASRVQLASGGHWHDRGWFGAVLTSADVARRASASEQRAGVLAFLESARAQVQPRPDA